MTWNFYKSDSSTKYKCISVNFVKSYKNIYCKFILADSVLFCYCFFILRFSQRFTLTMARLWEWVELQVGWQQLQNKFKSNATSKYYYTNEMSMCLRGHKMSPFTAMAFCNLMYVNSWQILTAATVKCFNILLWLVHKSDTSGFYTRFTRCDDT